MADAFISYRRKPSAALAQLVQEKLRNRHNIDAYVDTTRTDSSRVQFPERLMEAIGESPVFICLLGEGTLESAWVRKEIDRAYALHKHCIPVFQEGFVSPEDVDDAVAYLLRFDGVHIFDVKAVFIDESIEQIAALCAPFKIALPPSPPPRFPIRALVTLVVIVLVAAAALLVQSALNPGAPSPTPPLSAFDQLQTAQVQMTQGAATRTVGGLTATYDAVQQATATAAARQIMATETAAYATLLALSPTPDPLQVALQAARTFTGSNADWQALYPEGFVHSFDDGVPMALVPAGCFMMGSDEGRSDEQPVHEQCFDAPFWIDLTEVTQADFARLGGVKANASAFVGDQRPVERITWFEARDFCALRGVRLPTEREWEYAARGPAAWQYPWGDDWNPENLIRSRTSGLGTANAGSIGAGRSWVGALDMTGNVWEWISSLYETYPYDAQDDRERDAQSQTDVLRVMRGGSWYIVSSDQFRAAFRNRTSPAIDNYASGFRCARSS
ncbi:MAG: SUMF1/EgtB/PvdO family nonheme iron enzyme [Anaerolineae bacterium]|nr:SUMF1/EgtB/PvdO family nonheme iron enzyme [Anaerolineae bacterium]